MRKNCIYDIIQAQTPPTATVIVAVAASKHLPHHHRSTSTTADRHHASHNLTDETATDPIPIENCEWHG